MPSRTRRNDTRRRGWVRLTAAEATALSAENKQAIKVQLDRIIEQEMEPAALTRRYGQPGFAEVQALYTKWYGNHLVLWVKRHGGRVMGHEVADFETRSGRLTIVGADLFDVAYFRHTDRWWTIQSACSLKAALEYFRKPSPLWPW